MGVSRQEYWSGLPHPSLGDLPDPGIELTSPALADRLFFLALIQLESPSIYLPIIYPSTKRYKALWK